MRTRIHNGIEYAISEAHPAADAFPWVTPEEIEALAADIRTNGLADEILRLPDTRIIDGRNRELACLVAGVKPRYVTEDLDEDRILAVVISRNIHRRNLTVSQRAMIAAELVNMRPGDNQYKRCGNVATPQNLQNVGEKLDVSKRTVTSAVAVKNKAPELVEPIKAGKLDVHTAAKAADLPKKKREKIAAASDPKQAAKEELAKQEEEEPEEIDHGAEFVASVETLCRDMDSIAKRIKELSGQRFAYSIHLDSAASQVEAARKTLWQGRPAHTCPYCSGEGCKACNGTGRVKRSTYDAGREAMGDQS